jgi:hypothetical protein
MSDKSPTHFSRPDFLRQVYFVHASGMEAAHMHRRNKRPPCRESAPFVFTAIPMSL